MTVLLSIRPKYVDLIIKGVKKYEFRRQIFKREVEKVYIYCTNPVKRIVGFFTVEEILSDKPYNIWRLCKDEAGVTSEEFFSYFKNSKMAFAIKIGKVKKLKPTIEAEEIGLTIPQSFIYVYRNLEELRYFNFINSTILETLGHVAVQR